MSIFTVMDQKPLFNRAQPAVRVSDGRVGRRVETRYEGVSASYLIDFEGWREWIKAARCETVTEDYYERFKGTVYREGGAGRYRVRTRRTTA